MEVFQKESLRAHIDYKTLPPIEGNDMLNMINRFVSHNTQFLHNFALSVETRLREISQKKQHIESLLCMLESKLESIGNVPTTTPVAAQAPNPPTDTNTSTIPPPPSAIPPPPLPPPNAAPSVPEPPSEPIEEEDPAAKERAELEETYKKYIKVLRMNVPEQVVAGRLAQEMGATPDIIQKIISIAKG
ncbi:hypothetical protein RCL1_007798 [Eukaryota sp. TZLM3-RCL]